MYFSNKKIFIINRIIIYLFFIIKINCYENRTESIVKNLVLTKINHNHHQNTNLINITENHQQPFYTIRKNTVTGNVLWDGLINDCLGKPSFSCIQKNVFTYLDDTLNLGDINVTDRFTFKKNSIDYFKYTKDANLNFIDRNEINDEDDDVTEEEEGRAASPIEEVTNSLYDKGIKFMMTHDVELKMPEMMFDGATFKVSPRSIEGNGALVKIEFLPKTFTEVAKEPNKATGRIFFKKIKKFFKNKLLLAFLAIVVIIKIIKIKVLWILPLLVGVGTAKKLVLKVLLFLFPALAQIFKLCSYYHHNYHQTKYHHHQHHINHLHTIIPSLHDEGHHTAASPPYGSDVIYSPHPPKGHPSEYIYGAPPPPHSSSHAHEHNYWDFSGPGLGSEYIGDIHRNAQVNGNNFKPKLDDYNEIVSWGLGTTVAPISSHINNLDPIYAQDQTSQHTIYKAAANSINPVYAQPPKKNNVQTVAAQQFNPVAVDQHRLHAQEQLRIQHEQQLLNQQQNYITQSNVGGDPFYGPILIKIDKIFVQLGFNEVDEGCRERLVCSMYKNPARYSPHSNYLSAELSRDSSELQKPKQTTQAVVRFYRYVQAARDGQEQKNCLQIYNLCAFATE